MRRWIVPAAIGTAVLGSGSALAGPTQGIASGIYVLDEHRSENAFEAIEHAIADLPAAERPLTRMRLRKSIAVDRIRISRAEKRFGIAYDAKTPIVVWIGEAPIKWKLIEELVFDVSAKADGDAVSLTFRGDDSQRTTTYRSVGQDLVEDTTIISPLLTKPIIYKLIYNRTN